MTRTLKPIYVEDLPSKCDTPGCTHEHGPVYLHSRCHNDEPTWVTIDGDVLTVMCAVCEKPIVALRLAHKQGSN